MTDVRSELTMLRQELMDPVEPLPEDVLAEHLREVRLEEAELEQREVEGRPPLEEQPRS
jgi:hypothetical protein